MIEWLAAHPEVFVAWWACVGALVAYLLWPRRSRTGMLTDEDVRRASRTASERSER